MRTDIDYLVMGDYIFDKKEQPAWDEKDWKKKLLKD
jgi:carbamoyltransferase